VRLTGQDSRRGTFSHRHSVLIDATDETRYIPLNHIRKKQERIQIYNSHLSEYGVLGFEFGYAVAMPRALVIWEAQFGDFANGAQIIIDQFISSSESKWQRMSGIVMFLPHGSEGQGPEHSSARLSRYLELCAEHNMVVVNPTTPANMFHLLRRQVITEYCKPLVVMTPKSLLRHPSVRSDISELTKGQFREIIDDGGDPSKIRRVVLCCGKIYYDLAARRDEEGHEDVAIVRVEQLYPASPSQDAALRQKYSSIRDWVWVQEEAVNMGPWLYMRRRLADIPQLRVLSRRESASPATASLIRYKEQQRKLVDQAFAPTPVEKAPTGAT
jgi:2-oxoglutarate dehydrogenase E1 component